MASMVKVIGIKQVLKNLKLTNSKMGVNFERGLKKAALFLQRESMKLVPVDTGTLKNSSVVRVANHGMRADVTVQYRTKYAAFVHENLDALHGKAFNNRYKYHIHLGKNRKVATRGENQQAKYLEAPAREHRTKMLNIIGKTAKG